MELAILLDATIIDQILDSDWIWGLISTIICFIVIFWLIPRNNLYENIADAKSIKQRDQAIKRAQNTLSQKKIDTAVAEIPERLLSALQEADTPELFAELAVTAKKMGVSAYDINQLKVQMPAITLSQVASCRNNSVLAVQKQKAKAWGNNTLEIEKLATKAKVKTNLLNAAGTIMLATVFIDTIKNRKT